jgi:hypothetical protein
MTLAIGCLVATGAYASNPTADAIGQSGGAVGGRSDIPVLTSFPASGPALTDIWCTGMGFDNGIFWACGSDFDGNSSNGSGDNGIYFYDEAGTYLGGFAQPTQDTWGWRDSGYNGDHFMFGASSPHTGQIFWVNTNTLAVEYTVTGCGLAQCRALAVTSDLGGFIEYTAGDFSNPMEKRLWQVGNNPSQLLTTCTPPGAVYGLAYDSSTSGLWATSADYSGELYLIDAATCVTQQTYNILPEIEIFGGAAMAQTSHGCNLWVMCQCPVTDDIFGLATGGDNPFACSSTPVEPASWGSIKARYND